MRGHAGSLRGVCVCVCVCVYARACACEEAGRLVHGVTKSWTQQYTHMHQYTNNVYILINYIPKGI